MYTFFRINKTSFVLKSIALYHVKKIFANWFPYFGEIQTIAQKLFVFFQNIAKNNIRVNPQLGYFGFANETRPP